MSKLDEFIEDVMPNGEPEAVAKAFVLWMSNNIGHYDWQRELFPLIRDYVRQRKREEIRRAQSAKASARASERAAQRGRAVEVVDPKDDWAGRRDPLNAWVFLPDGTHTTVIECTVEQWEARIAQLQKNVVGIERELRRCETVRSICLRHSVEKLKDLSEDDLDAARNDLAELGRP